MSASRAAAVAALIGGIAAACGPVVPAGGVRKNAASPATSAATAQAPTTITRPIELIPFLKTNDLSNFNTERAEQSRFHVEDEVLHVKGGPGQIETNNEYANFVLQLECKVNGDGLNSGVFFRALRTARGAGYESQIHNAFKGGDPTKPVDFGTGGIYRRQPARRIIAEDRQWFTKTIVADGPHMAVWVNGYQVSDWTDTRPPHENARNGLRLGPGAIAIQGHDPTTDLSFRNFRVAELPR